jgi:N-acetylmuramoyl-L-alanine amidase
VSDPDPTPAPPSPGNSWRARSPRSRRARWRTRQFPGRRLLTWFALPTAVLLTATAADVALNGPPFGGTGPSRAAGSLPVPVPASPEETSPAPEASGPPGTGTVSPGPSTSAPGAGGLSGRTIAIDPGHNGRNYAHPEVINRKVNVVTGTKACNTTGTQSRDGYAEHAFTWDLANRLAAVLRAEGATVVLTRDSDTGVGPCITERAAIGNRAHADLALSLHADGGPTTGRGFHVIMPGSVGPNAAIVAPSARLGRILRDAFRAGTGEPVADYIARNGLTTRTDLGGLNLSTVPAVFLECGNMRNAADARSLADPGWRQDAATAIATGLTTYLAPPP